VNRADPRSARWPRIAARVLGAMAGGEVLTTLATHAPLVALTLDDGPHPATTPQLLDVLATYGVQGTFFVTGAGARAHPALLARIAAAGHELGNHLEDGTPSVLLGADEFDRQLTAVHELLAAHGPVRFFRPGSGWFTPNMLRSGARLGYRCALGSPGLAVSRYPDPRSLGDRLAARCGAGDVVVLHEGLPARAAVADVADALLAGLTLRGLAATTLTRLAAA